MTRDFETVRAVAEVDVRDQGREGIVSIDHRRRLGGAAGFDHVESTLSNNFRIFQATQQIIFDVQNAIASHFLNSYGLNKLIG
jgi:hypothetical protein